MTKRVLIAGFKHETNTFSVLPTDIAAYRERGLYSGAEVADVFRETNSEIAGFIDVAERHGWQPQFSLVADASPSGRVTQAAYEEITGQILADAVSAGPVDAVLLQLHGAMVTDHTDDGEGLLLRTLRTKLGPSVPIGVTLDLHGNVTDDMARYADVIVSYRTYPHIDQREIANECGDLIARAVAGEIAPFCTVRRGPMMGGVDHGRTTAPGPMREALAKAEELKASPTILSVSVLAGFGAADIPDVGPSVIVVGDGYDPIHRSEADRLVSHIWETRDVRSVDPSTNAEAVTAARKNAKIGAPVIIADAADNPGGGGYGDSTGLLHALFESNIDNIAFGALFDPESATACHAASKGEIVDLRLGGKVDTISGPPLMCKGEVLTLSDGRFRLEGPMQAGVPVNMGPSAAVRVGGIDIVIASRRYQNYDRNFFRTLGLEPADYAVIVVKSSQHFRAAYAPGASDVVMVDEGNGITTFDLTSRTYSNVRRPIWPLDLN
ncbi:MAG: M81 family metallopeptidase [Pseudomonadota bacterium]